MNWKMQAVAWLRGKAAEQEQNNERWPEHAKCYQTWRDYVTFAQRLADELEREPSDCEPQSAEATAAGLTFCCGKDERLTNEIAALRNVVQRAMIADCKEAFEAWNYYFPDKPMEPYQRPNV